jgi:aminoglycoside phosphotransferase (APT) family kinase protein
MAGAELPDADLLDAGSVLAYLAGRHVLGRGPGVTAEILAGGVSNVVLAAGGGERQVVVKQALARLRVADEWYAPPGRAMIEADALELAGALTPAEVPRLVDRDPGRHALTIERAPSGWRDWKTQLLGGRADAAVARHLGRTLACWHSRTANGPLPAALEATSHFDLLRVDPYYRTVARRAPELSGPVTALAEQMAERRSCLVHGDFSPKNVLVGPDGLWVIDFEVAHRGDPAFDIAFMLCHLLLKSVHRPDMAGQLDACGTEFTDAYTAAVPPELRPPWDYVFGHVACLVLARVKGKSPAEYLTGAEQARAWHLGTDVLHARPGSLPELYERRDRVWR